MIVLQIGKNQASIVGQAWSSDNKDLESLLNNWTRDSIDMAVPDSPLYAVDSPSEPHPSLVIATEVIKLFGGKIISDDGPPEYDEDLIY